MKKIKNIFLLILFLFINPISTYATSLSFSRTEDNLFLPSDIVVNENNKDIIMKTPAVFADEKIYDFVDLFTDKQEKKIKEDLDSFISYSNMDAVVVVTDNLNGFDVEDYCYNFYDYNDFKDDGVLLLIFVGNEEPVIYMANSGKSVDIYTDIRIQQILEYIYKNISSGNYFLAVGDYIKILNGFYDIDTGDNYKINANGIVVKDMHLFDIFVLSLSLAFIFIMLIYFRVSNRNKINFYDIFDSSIDMSSMIVKTIRDEVIDSDKK